AGGRSDLSRWYQGAQINRDRDLRLQYLAGWGINAHMEDELYRQMMSYVRPPAGLFEGSPELVTTMLSAFTPGTNTSAQP
ncbi:MAG TPA: hypothetical protein VKG79_03535, partial [Bryobacteraceae bacterium]|nr:hypothetical protein [Bryobacteraceae bacterium]